MQFDSCSYSQFYCRKSMLWSENQIQLCAFLLFPGQNDSQTYTLHEKEIFLLFPSLWNPVPIQSSWKSELPSLPGQSLLSSLPWVGLSAVSCLQFWWHRWQLSSAFPWAMWKFFPHYTEWGWAEPAGVTGKFGKEVGEESPGVSNGWEGD